MSEPKETAKVSLQQVFEGQKKLEEILSTPREAKVSYRLNKIANVLLREFKEIERVRISLVDKYGKIDDKGNSSVLPERFKEFKAEFEQFLDLEIDLDVQLIPFSCLKNIPISAADLLAIQPFMEEPNDIDLCEPQSLMERKLG